MTDLKAKLMLLMSGRKTPSLRKKGRYARAVHADVYIPEITYSIRYFTNLFSPSVCM